MRGTVTSHTRALRCSLASACSSWAGCDCHVITITRNLREFWKPFFITLRGFQLAAVSSSVCGGDDVDEDVNGGGGDDG